MKQTDEELMTANVLFHNHAQIQLQMGSHSDEPETPIGHEGRVTIALTDGTVYRDAAVFAYLPQGVCVRHLIDDVKNPGLMANTGREFIPYGQIKSILEGARNELWKD